MKLSRLSFILLIQLTTAAAATEDAPTAVQPATQSDFEQRIHGALRSLRFEPSLKELKKAALRFADADVERARSWRRAPNAAAALPTLKFVFMHDLERDESLDRYQDEPDRWGADTDTDLAFQISAQWRLDELIFNPDEVRVWNALADRASRRDAVLTVLLGYYFERQKLQLQTQLTPPASLEDAVQLKLRIAELTASIDAMTNGLLSKRIRAATGN